MDIKQITMFNFDRSTIRAIISLDDMDAAERLGDVVIIKCYQDWLFEVDITGYIGNIEQYIRQMKEEPDKKLPENETFQIGSFSESSKTCHIELRYLTIEQAVKLSHVKDFIQIDIRRYDTGIVVTTHMNKVKYKSNILKYIHNLLGEKHDKNSSV